LWFQARLKVVSFMTSAMLSVAGAIEAGLNCRDALGFRLHSGLDPSISPVPLSWFHYSYVAPPHMSKRRAQSRGFQKFCRKDATLALVPPRFKRCSMGRKLSQITDAQARRGSYLPRSQRVALSHAGDSLRRRIS
jgi:hypothetical protein